ncbi:hypothetical protein [Rhizobium sp. NFR07]|uniref:hypothetical protein n=1 Tax=Rhizobium sp. NFR07 TaxID=1566262 RepID=UPI001FCD4866|nr:hypothetical protein [Rhizobium sp. NFR07]
MEDLAHNLRFLTFHLRRPARIFLAITLKQGNVQETNFDRYPVLRINEMPAVEMHIVASDSKPTGMGEPGMAPIAPAIANAIFALSGTLTQRLPFLNGAVNAGLSIGA